MIRTSSAMLMRALKSFRKKKTGRVSVGIFRFTGGRLHEKQ